MKIKNINIVDIKPYENNAKEHPEEQIDKIKNSIKQFGFNDPIAIDEQNIIIEGHGRYLAAKKLKLKLIPTIQLKHLTETQKKAYIIAHNQITLSTGFDLKLLQKEINFIKLHEPKLETFTFVEENYFDEFNILKEMEEENVVEDNFTGDIQDIETDIKLGDMFKLGNHKLLCGDSTLTSNIYLLMENKKANMIFTDPPYGINLKTNFQDGFGNKNKNYGRNYKPILNDDKDYDPGHIFRDFQSVKEIFLWGADYYAEKILNKNKGSWVIWDKRYGIEDVNFCLSEFETCWSKSKHARKIARFTWFGFTGFSGEDTKTRIHPTQKPLKLIEWFFKQWGNEGDLVVDLFGGSGSTLITCEQMNRTCYMMELDPQYCQVIIDRWEQYTQKKAKRI